MVQFFLQRNSTLGRCKIGKYMFPSQVANIFLTHQTFVTNLHPYRSRIALQFARKTAPCDRAFSRLIATCNLKQPYCIEPTKIFVHEKVSSRSHIEAKEVVVANF